MHELRSVYDATSLSKSKTYLYQRNLYRFVSEDPYTKINHPRYCFEPLGGQRRKCQIFLNKNNLFRMQEIVGLRLGKMASVTNKKYIQLSLF